VDDDILREGMKRAARLNRIVAVHAESEAMTAGLASRMAAEGRTGIRDYLDSRPIEAELDAIARALALAADTGCALHIVHVSCGAGITLIASAKKMGIDVSCETCPHYLVLTEDDLLAIGAVAKCAPPLRPAAARETLWRCLEAGCVNTIGSDHSPSPPGMKTDADFFKIWGGISGAQHTLPLLLTHGHVDRNIALPLLGRLLSFDVARRFSLPPSKGGIALGVDADLTVVDLGAQFCVQEADLLYQHRQTPYLGRRLRGRVRRTMLRGRTIIKDSQIAAEPLGQLVRPET